MWATARARRLRAGALLLGLALLLIVGSRVAQQRQVPPRVPLDAGAYLLLVVVVVAVAGRTRWPRAVFGATVAAVGAWLALGYPYGPIFVGVSVAAFALATAVRPVVCAGAVALAVAVWVAAEVPAVAGSGQWGELVPLALGSAAWVTVPVWLAALRSRAAEARAAERDRSLRELGELRLELAREVHDVVAHNLTVIGVQAGAALRVFDRDPDTARDALTTIARTNRRALSELRSTVELLRGPATGDTTRAGPGGAAGVGPDLAGIGALVESARGTGATVSLTVSGPLGDVAAPVQRAGHRIVQEALTNALRHAPGAAIDVLVDVVVGVVARAADERVVVEVADDGPGRGRAVDGRGTAGMRERAGAVGGVLSVTAGAGGGTTVRATLPARGPS